MENNKKQLNSAIKDETGFISTKEITEELKKQNKKKESFIKRIFKKPRSK